MISMPILGLGFLGGMQHALEADHIAAVSSTAARRTRMADIVKHGLTWELGHTLTLFSFAGAAIVLGWAIPDALAKPLEAAVGVMLVGLGAHVLRQLWCDRVHFHRHRNGVQHIRAQQHGGRVPNGSAEDDGHGLELAFVLILSAPMWNPVAGAAVCVNMLDTMTVPAEMHAVAAQLPQHVGSKADEHDANRSFEGLRECVGDTPTQHDRSACE